MMELLPRSGECGGLGDNSRLEPTKFRMGDFYAIDPQNILK
jgi:hypothetical protein